MIEVFTEILTATLIIMVWSFLYRENIFYRIAEHIAVGSFFGYTLYMGIRALYDKTFTPLISTGNPALAIVTFFGILMWLRLIPKIRWISRIPIALLAGISMGVAVRGAISKQIIAQAKMGSWIAGDIMTSINNIIVSVFTVCVLLYFIYSREHTGPLGVIAKIGRYAMMIAFGAILGTFLMGNTAFSIGQIPKLVSGYGMYVSIIAVVLIVIDFWKQRGKEKEEFS